MMNATAGTETTDPTRDPKTVLVIEDEERVRAVTAKMLESLGYRPVAARNTAAARDLLAQERIDLVLSDVVLSGDISGPEFAKEVQTQHPGLPIVFMSGYPAEATQGVMEFSADIRLLHKPFRMRQLDQVLRAALT